MSEVLFNQVSFPVKSWCRT